MGIKINKEKEKCTWFTDNLKITFSKPSITTSHNNKIKTLSQAMYFDYNLKVSVKTRKSFKSNTKKWKKEFSIFVGDFPAIDALQHYLRLCVEDKVPESSIAVEYFGEDKEEKLTTYSWTNESAFVQDIYSVKKVIREGERGFKDDIESFKEVSYNFAVGYCNYLGNGFSRLVSEIALPEESIKELLSCIDTFIELGIDIYNSNIEKDWAIQTKNKKIVDDALYVNTEKTSNMEMYCCGDVFRNPSVVVNRKHDTTDLEVEELKGYYQIVSLNKEYNQVLFRQVSKDSERNKWVFTDGNPAIVYVDNLFDIGDFMIEDTPYLMYGLDEIVNDFASILKHNVPSLCDEILEDLDKYDNIGNKVYYVGLILNRYWMCRQEHPYIDEKPDGIDTETWVRNFIVTVILDKIKKKVNEEVQ